MKQVGETDEEKFKRLAVARVRKSVNYIRLIGNLSNRINYKYSKKDVDKIFAALRKEIDLAEARFNERDRPRKFILD
jgi:hypothetical protein